MNIGPAESLILTLLSLAALIVGAVLLARWLASVIRSAVRSEVRGLGLGPRSTREVLDEPYARGDVGREEYEEIRRDLTV